MCLFLSPQMDGDFLDFWNMIDDKDSAPGEDFIHDDHVSFRAQERAQFRSQQSFTHWNPAESVLANPAYEAAARAHWWMPAMPNLMPLEGH